VEHSGSEDNDDRSKSMDSSEKEDSDCSSDYVLGSRHSDKNMDGKEDNCTNGDKTNTDLRASTPKPPVECVKQTTRSPVRARKRRVDVSRVLADFTATPGIQKLSPSKKRR